MLYIIATAALRTGINVLGITHVIYLKGLHNIINYAQKARRARRARERVIAIIIIENKD